MDKFEVNIVNNKSTDVIEGQTTLFELSKKHQKLLKGKILLAKVDGMERPLYTVINKPCSIEFMDITYREGYRAYQRSCSFVMLAAFNNILGSSKDVWVEHTIDNNYFCSIDGIKVTKELIKKLEDKMDELIEADYSFEKFYVSVDEGIKIFKKYGMERRVRSLKYITGSNITIYRLNDYYDYLYGEMVPSTSYVKIYGLKIVEGGFILRFESAEHIGKAKEPKLYPKLATVFNDFTKWSKIHGVDTVSSLNDIVSSGRKSVQELIWLSEGLHENNMAKIAGEVKNKGKRLIMIAGPSSSSKTTFARRLCIQLRVMGLRPHIISLDNYYKNRMEIPVEADGTRNFECLESLNVEQFNDHLLRMLAGEKVEVPEYNFYTGCQELNGNYMKLEKDDVIVIEGIHGINEKLTPKIPREDKFKIYISCLTQLNIDEHNRISTTDTRLLRRLVRDYNFRGFDARTTINMWPKVMAGEEQNIFPYQEEADAMFNTSLDYELAVLKPYAESVLYEVDRSEACYSEAKRLIQLLDCFLTISPNDIPPNSLLREFIGGSCFYNN